MKTKGTVTLQAVVYCAVILLAIIGTINYWLYTLSVYHLEQSLIQSADSKLNTLESLTEYYIEHFEDDLIIEMAKETKKQHDVTYLSIINDSNEPYFIQGDSQRTKQKLFKREIHDGKDFLGSITIGLDTKSQGEKKRKALITLFASIILSVSSLSGLLLLFYRNQIVNKIKNAEQAKQFAEDETAFFNAIIETSTSLVIVLNSDGRIKQFNKTSQKFFFRKQDEIIGTTIWSHFNIRYDDFSLKECLEHLGSLGTSDNECFHSEWDCICANKQGDECILEWSITKLDDLAGNLKYIILTGQDITQRHLERITLSHKAHYDSLTQLPNRSLFKDRLIQSAKGSLRYDKNFALLYIDLDNFKPINDDVGHDAGDFVLKEVSKRLIKSVRESDTVARIGGDEFSIILMDVSNDSKAGTVAQKIIDAIGLRIQFSDHTLQIGVSIGIAMFPKDANNIEQLIKRADQAMYKAKNSGKNRYHYYGIE